LNEEFMSMKGLRHPNILQVLELYIDSDSNCAYLVMELIEGVDAMDYLNFQERGKRG
jgi:serine/threonine protein kinase